jgi:hypothetical protein
MHETNCTFAVEKESEPITIESLRKIYTEAKIIPVTFKPTGETVYITAQMRDYIERCVGGQNEPTN